MSQASAMCDRGGPARPKLWFPRIAKEREVRRCSKCGHVRVVVK